MVIQGFGKFCDLGNKRRARKVTLKVEGLGQHPVGDFPSGKGFESLDDCLIRELNVGEFCHSNEQDTQSGEDPPAGLCLVLRTVRRSKEPIDNVVNQSCYASR